MLFACSKRTQGFPMVVATTIITHVFGLRQRGSSGACSYSHGPAPPWHCLPPTLPSRMVARRPAPALPAARPRGTHAPAACARCPAAAPRRLLGALGTREVSCLISRCLFSFAPAFALVFMFPARSPESAQTTGAAAPFSRFCAFPWMAFAFSRETSWFLFRCSFFSLPGSPDLRTLLTFVESVLQDDDGRP